jgi:tetratricopeptide (TPR) repeat protein
MMMPMQNFKKLYFVCIFLGFSLNVLSQDSTTIVDAKNFLQYGLVLIKSKNYPKAIDYLLVSISQVPTPIAYYLLADAYAKNADPESALRNANIAINMSPPIKSKYLSDLIKIRDWATHILQSSYTVSGDAITNRTMSSQVIIPDESDDFYADKVPVPTYANFINKILYSTDRPQFTAYIVNSNNNIVGYINFFGFANARIINGETVASSFSIPFRRIIDATNTEWGNITYKANDLYPGSIKQETLGNIVFKTIILSVKKSDANNYYLNSVKVQVNAYVY